MRHNSSGGHGRHGDSHSRADRQYSRHHHHGHRRGGPARLFDYGELRLVVLALIAEEPRHGYEVIKLIEERSGGGYAPSPGVIYPTLSWLDDMGYVRIEREDSGRKRYRLSEEGHAFLEGSRGAVEDLLARLGANVGQRPADVPSPVIRAMENFKTAMRLRLKQGPLNEAAADGIAAALDAAAKVVEKS